MLMASGLTLIFGIMHIVNFAHGQFYMLGSFILYYLFELAGVNYIIAIIASMAAMAALGILIERGLLRPLLSRPLIATLALTLGLIMVLEGISILGFGLFEKPVHSPVTGVINLGAAIIPMERVVVIIIAAVVMVGLYYFLQRTKQGTAVRATSQDPYAATLQGANMYSIRIIVMGIGCALASVAGCIMAPLFYVDPWIGHMPLFKALIIITLGGMGSIPGAALGAVILGFLESFGFTYFGEITEIIGFVLVILILLVRPQGLFGVPYELAE